MSTWSSFATVEDAFTSVFDSPRAFSGIGFVFSDDDPYVGVDIDKCRNPITGEVSELAKSVGAVLAGAYAEISPSETGLHLIVRGRLPFKGKKDDTIGLEMYQAGRYFCVTGHAIDGAA